MLRAMLTRRSRQALQAGSAFLTQASRTANAAAVHPGCACGSARTFSDQPTFDYEPDYGKKHDIVRKHGVDVLHDPLYNKVNCLQPGSTMCSCATCVAFVHGKQCMIHGATKFSRCTCLQGTGFPLTERERLGIRGLLPPRSLNMERQVCAVLCKKHLARTTCCVLCLIA